MSTIVQLQHDNIQYEKLSETYERDELITRNLNIIYEILAQLDTIRPIESTVEINPKLVQQRLMHNSL